MISINTLNGGNMSIVTGTPGPVSHPETRVKYTESSGITPREQTFDIEGELTEYSITDIWDVEEVDIGNTVTSIGPEAFCGCSGLTSVTFNGFTKNEVKSMTASNSIFGDVFYDDEDNPMEKSFTAICTDGSMTIHFSANDPATITFTDL